MAEYNYRRVTPPRRKLSPEQRRRMLKKRKMQQLKRRLKWMIPIAVLIVLAVVLIVTLGGGSPDAQRDNTPALSLIDQAEVGQTDDTAASPVDPTQQPVAEVTAEAVETQAPVAGADFNYDEAYVQAVRGNASGSLITPDYSKVDPNKLSRWPQTAENTMPVIYKANTEENIIAITVDDCYQAKNLQRIVQCALDNSAKLTIFPIGDNIARAETANVVKWAWQNGMEIENHTYNHVGLYHYDDDRMTEEIWQQSQLLNQVLGVNYQEHFFRPHGGDERDDQRDHAYINQLGFNGVAIWSQDGSKSSLDKLYSSLGPGEIYLFHTTDNDLSLLLQFIPAAVQRGYRLVTMNEMFGLPENETGELQSQTKPALEAFRADVRSFKKTSYARAIAPIQARLIELGWMEGEPTGVYGETTYTAVGFFQRSAGLNTDGIAGAETQQKLFSDSAPAATADEQTAIRERLEKLASEKKK